MAEVTRLGDYVLHMKLEQNRLKGLSLYWTRLLKHAEKAYLYQQGILEDEYACIKASMCPCCHQTTRKTPWYSLNTE